jgi:hypothetical protein
VGGQAVREIRNVVDSNCHKVFFLWETRLSATRAHDMCHGLGFPNAFRVSSQGFSGGLAVMWQNDLSVVIKTYSKYHIDVWITKADRKH